MIGSSIGLIIQKQIDPEVMPVAQSALGVFTLALGFKMFLGSRNLPWLALALCLGGVTGYLLGLHQLFLSIGNDLRRAVGGSANFTEGFAVTFILFCIGPMTILGCLEDAIERKITLLSSKSVMDGFSAIFFAAAYGPALFATGVALLVFQGVLTLLAKPLQRIIGDENTIAEITGTGGLILVIVGINMLEIKELNSVDYLPSLIYAVIFAKLVARFSSNKQPLNQVNTF